MDACPSELERERLLTGAASEDAVVRLELHLEACADCRAWFAVARADEELLGPLREVWREVAAGPPPGALPPLEIDAQALGRYRIGRLLGSGGMGVVYEAEQSSPRRKVALKVVRPGFSSDQLLRRFEFEAEVLSRLDHPGIAKIYEAGTLGSRADRRPFFSMELVEGRSLMRYAEDRGPDLHQRLRLFGRICSAVEHAHQKGVVHRDLKPSNILVSDAGDPKILDFGVARVTGTDVQRATLHTNVGQIVGTLAYISPEQVGDDPEAVDVRSDVYSLGVLFHEILAGERPYDVGDRPITEAVRIIREQAPRPLGAVSASLRGDLQTIAAKALEKDPERRYASAGELAADVARYLNREPIAARPPSAVYQLVRYSQRHRAVVVGGVAVFLALLAGLVVNLFLKEEARRERNNVLRLSAFRELEELQRRADALWPIHPDRIPDFAAWLKDAAVLVDGLYPDPAEDDPGHYAQRESIRARALPPTAAEGERLAGLGAEIPPRRPYRFEDGKDGWWHEQLDELVTAIEAFADPWTGLVTGISPRFGWGVERRLWWAREIEERSTTGEEVRDLWRTAIESIADEGECPAYGGLSIEPQLGLVPVGRDPDSGLWEFAHVLSGERPTRDTGGHCVVGVDTGLVFVLIPGGIFLMGAQGFDPSGPNYFDGAGENEGPVHEVTLTPFFLSKFEMTQGQWERLTGGNPSSFGPGGEDPSRMESLRHPVENVRWQECHTTLAGFGLGLPTEAQWEYATRAGTTTPWWVGTAKEDLVDSANLADATCRAESTSVSWVFEEWDDGHYQHAPVGTFRANAFGLHDVVGNLWEWCADGYDSMAYKTGPAVDPFVSWEETRSVTARGGSWNDPAAAARSSIRNSGLRTYRGRTMGVRPARALLE